MIAGTRALAPLIAGLALSHLSYPSVAWIQVQYWTFKSDNLDASFQAAVLLIFTVGQVRVCFPNPLRPGPTYLSTTQVLMFRVLHSQHSELAEERKGVPANVTSDGKEKFLEGLCRKAKHTGSFLGTPAQQISLSLSWRIPVLCQASALPRWSQCRHALPHRPWL